MVTLRPIASEEFPAFLAAFTRQFGEVPSERMVNRWRPLTEFDRSLAAVDDAGTIVGTSLSVSFRMQVPGAVTACSGITDIGVRTDHRRQGLMTRMMRHQLELAADRGEPISALYASEASIYGRFGYGAAVPATNVRVHTYRTGLAVSPRTAACLVPADIALAQCPAIFERAVQERAGVIERSPQYWDALFGSDDEGERGGASPRYWAFVEDRGYVCYRLHDVAVDGARGNVVVSELVATDADAYAGLWDHLMGIDLFDVVTAKLRPVDEPLPHMVTDAGHVKVSAGEPMYVRLVDVGAALSLRTYTADGALTITVEDPIRPANSGRWALEGGPGGATCTPTTAEPDLSLDVTTLGSLYLGGHRWRTMAAAARVTEHRPGALSVADAMFTPGVAPWNVQEF